MPTLPATVISAARRKPIAACVMTAFALAPAAAIANVIPVSNCNDHGPGSLRAAVGAAGENDFIDLSALSCTISLNTGAITINQNTLYLFSSYDRVTVSGKYNGAIEQDRVLNHQGTGNLHLENVNVTFGSLYTMSGPALGGCIYSKGSVFLRYSTVSVCKANAKSAGAGGGGVATKGNLYLLGSTIASNTVGNLKPTLTLGGGAYVAGNFGSAYDTISGNNAIGGTGGGVWVGKSGNINRSTISGNKADSNAGLHFSSLNIAAHAASILNSTISGNTAQVSTVGGVFSTIPITVEDSTIAFNTSIVGKNGAGYFAPGLAVAMEALAGNLGVTLQSTLISNNTYGSTENDFSSIHGSGTVTISGANNLIRATTSVVPFGTITGSCPRLGKLRDNGGLTRTHALLSRSPAIDAGNHVLNTNYDQRGPHLVNHVVDYPRVDNGTVDIGAYEVQQGDVVFNDEFEACPPVS